MGVVGVAIVWFIFTVIFAWLGFYYWQMAKRKIKHFPHIYSVSYRDIPTMEMDLELGPPNPTGEFAKLFNKFLDDYNWANEKGYKASAYGFWVASLTAVLSLLLTLTN